MVKRKEARKRYLELNTLASKQLNVEARNVMKEVVKAVKMELWEEFGRYIEDNYKANQKRFWSPVKGLRKARVSRARSVKNEEGNLITDTQQILEVWGNYYEKVFKE